MHPTRRHEKLFFQWKKFLINYSNFDIKRSVLFLIRCYQLGISPLIGPVCRFYPTCSEYTYQAVCRYGFVKGSLLGVKRILKCHPFHPGGYDPVP